MSERRRYFEEGYCYHVLNRGAQRRQLFFSDYDAEWEFACRAGATTVRPFGETAELLGAYAWHEDNSAQRTHPVASLKPNDFGLFDTLGNVWEWCQNRVYQKELPADVEDCSAVSNQELRALRGCSYDDDARLARAANRFNHHPDSRAFYGGFRIARTIAN